jgi:hypothetical protein
MAVHSKVHCNVKSYSSQPKSVKFAQKVAPKPAKVTQKTAKAPLKLQKILPKAEKSSAQSLSQPNQKKLVDKAKVPAEKRAETDSSVVAKKAGGSSSAVSVAALKHLTPTVKAITMKGNRCSACRESVSSLKAFYEHVLASHFENPLQCPFCERTAKLGVHMRSHLRHHQNVFCTPEPRQNAGCTDSSSEKASTAQPKSSTKSKFAPPQQSLQDMETGSTYENKCPLCSLKFKSQVLLNGHIRTSHRLEPAK